MFTLLLATVLTMADQTHVYEITWDAAKTEKQVQQDLSEFRVLQVKKLGVASKQKKWSVVIQHKGTKQKVRDDVKKLSGVSRVKILE